MNSPCPYICNNKTEYGYCKTTGCINPTHRTPTFTSYDPIEIARQYAPKFDKPEVEVAEVRHGRWVHKYGDGHEKLAILGGECSICGYVHTATPYCPNCGARMDEESDDENWYSDEYRRIGEDERDEAEE